MSEDNRMIRTISPQDAFRLIKKHEGDPDFIILDVRPRDDYEKEHIPGAKNLDYDGHEFQKKVEKLDKEKNYLIYCKTGVRGGYFLDKMRDSGFNQGHNILGGFVAWKISKLPFEGTEKGGDWMQKPRKIIDIVEPIYVLEGAGVLLRRSIATQTLDYLDPFLLFDHFGSEDPQDYLDGFPMHPHRGIETVTYMLDGQVDHKDSIGNSGTIGKGDIQWMTSGSGILHEEMPKEPKEGMMEGFQLWVNLPAKLKMTDPRYQEVKASKIPEVHTGDGVVVKIIAGEFEGVRGAVTDIFADPEYLDVSIPAGCSFEQPVKRGHTAFAYVFEGEGIFGDFELESLDNGVLVPSTQLIVFGDGDLVRASARKNVRFLLVSGNPLNEPIARYGPFVMNTTEEIQQALEDLQNGTFVK